jgi:hypothetical protein
MERLRENYQIVAFNGKSTSRKRTSKEFFPISNVFQSFSGVFNLWSKKGLSCTLYIFSIIHRSCFRRLKAVKNKKLQSVPNWGQGWKSQIILILVTKKAAAGRQLSIACRATAAKKLAYMPVMKLVMCWRPTVGEAWWNWTKCVNTGAYYDSSRKRRRRRRRRITTTTNQKLAARFADKKRKLPTT